MRFRITAPPSFLVTVKPNRGPGGAIRPSGRRRASIRNDVTDARVPPRMPKNSGRFLRVTMANGGASYCDPQETDLTGTIAPETRRMLGRKALAALGAAAGQNPLATHGQHPLAKTVAALANKAARLIRAFHGNFSVTSGGLPGSFERADKFMEFQCVNSSHRLRSRARQTWSPLRRLWAYRVGTALSQRTQRLSPNRGPAESPQTTSSRGFEAVTGRIPETMTLAISNGSSDRQRDYNGEHR